MNKKQVLGLACVLACVATSATSATTVRAGVWIDDVQFGLTDLNPNDSYQPLLRTGGANVDLFYDALAPSPMGSEWAGNAEVIETDSALMGRATDRGSSFTGVADRWAPSFTFTVAPQTRVEIVAPYRFDVMTSSTAPGASATAGGFASFELAVLAVNNVSYNAEYDDYDYDVLAYDNQLAYLGQSSFQAISGTHHQSGQLTIAFDNDSNVPAVFAYRGELVVWGGHEAVAPVPEPGTIGLMLGGFAFVAWRVARRRDDQARKVSDQIDRAQLQA